MAYGRLSTVTAPPPAGVTTTPVTIYAYDGFDRAISTTYPDNTASTPDVTSQSYDANGNVVARVTRDGQTISLSYDALNRVTQKSASGGPAADSAGLPNEAASYVYDLTGKLGITVTVCLIHGGRGAFQN